MNFTTLCSKPIVRSIPLPANRILPGFLVALALAPASGLAQKVGVSMVNQVLGSEPLEFIGKLDQLRPPAVSAEHRAQVLSLLPTEGEVKKLNESQRSKIAALDRVLRAHGRHAAYEVKVIAVPQAFVGLHERTVVLLSIKAIDLVTAAELQALAAHEVGHEYVWQQWQSAFSRKDNALLRQLELYCDAVAIATLDRIGADPADLFSAIRKISGYNLLRLGIALNEDSYPKLATRKAFAASMIESVTSASGRRGTVWAKGASGQSKRIFQELIAPGNN